MSTEMVNPPDASPIEQIVVQHSAVVYSVCRRQTNTLDLAWDAYQETFLALVRQQDSLDLTADLSSWLCETARRCSLAVLRKNRREGCDVEAKLDNTIPDRILEPESSIAIAEFGSVLHDELDKLSSEDRKLIELVYIDGKSHREAAEIIQCPPGSVNYRLQQLRERLASKLKKRGIVWSVLLLLLFLLQSTAEAGVTGSGEPQGSSPQPPKQNPQRLLRARLRQGLVIVFLVMLFLAAGRVVLVQTGVESIDFNVVNPALLFDRNSGC